MVDQFEEVFAFRGSENPDVPSEQRASGAADRGRRRAEAEEFVTLLLELSSAKLPVYVVLTMRSDFLGECDVFTGLPEAMNRSRYLVPRLTRSQLALAIRGPARLGGTDIAPRLLDRLLNELDGRSDQLPVLQHALLRTWSAWNKGASGPIDQQHYEAIGTLSDALSRDANDALSGVDAKLAERVFGCLTEVDAWGAGCGAPTA